MKTAWSCDLQYGAYIITAKRGPIHVRFHIDLLAASDERVMLGIETCMQALSFYGDRLAATLEETDQE